MSPRFLLPLLLALAPVAGAQEFSAQVLPPRFEDAVRAGTVYRNVVEVQNATPMSARFGVRTADWMLKDDGNVEFDYGLKPDSCRPWVGLEASEIRLDGNGRKRFRFEVAVPAGAPAGQCRFAIMIEGDPQKTANGMTVAGRIAVIVYLDVGGASAQLALHDARVVALEVRVVPMLRVENRGNAHGRLEGLVDGRDAGGRIWSFTPANDPILPGTTRLIPLQPVVESEGPTPELKFPVQLRGQLDWRSQRIPVDTTAAK